jgi:hypothetical protein
VSSTQISVHSAYFNFEVRHFSNFEIEAFFIIPKQKSLCREVYDVSHTPQTTRDWISKIQFPTMATTARLLTESLSDEIANLIDFTEILDYWQQTHAYIFACVSTNQLAEVDEYRSGN